MISGDFPTFPAPSLHRTADGDAAGASIMPPLVIEETCPVIFADMVCLGTSPQGLLRVTYFAVAEST